MKERPILFSTPMVQAIMEGKKTMTRRVIKQDLDDRGLRFFNGWEDWHGRPIKCPFGEIGDRLWVRETWQHAFGRYWYKADGYAWHDAAETVDQVKWKPSIHMPRIASRITLEIVNIKVERLNDISHEDAKREGVQFMVTEPFELRDKSLTVYQIAFSRLWEKINGTGSWEANPWLWVIEFKRVK